MLPVPRNGRSFQQRAMAAVGSPIGVLAVAGPVAVGMALLRLDGWDSLPGRMLWAEDGHVFITGALQDGVGALLTPYAGYLHLFPRLAAWLATSVNIHLLAPLLGAAWLAAYCATALICVQRLRAVGARLSTALLYLVPLGMLPTSSETLFTVTNAQWYLGIGLTACALIPPRQERDSWRSLVFAAVVSLTGPFCIILLPIAVLQTVLLRNAAARQHMLVVLLAGACFQLSFFVESDRMAAAFNRDPAAWLQGLRAFATFASPSRAVQLAAVVFWGAALAAFGGLALRQGAGNRQVVVSASLFAATALFAAAGYYAMREQPQLASPLGWGARYFVIPYAVALLAAIVASLGNRLLLFTTMAAFVVVCALSYQKLGRSDLRYAPYIAFAEAHGKVLVPINPQFDSFRGGFQLDLPVPPGRMTSHAVDPRQVQLREVDGALLRVIRSADIGCPLGTGTLGIEVQMVLQKASNALVRWKSEEGTAQGSLALAYPEGPSLAQFAVSHAAGDDDELIISLPAEAGRDAIGSLEFFCIPGLPSTSGAERQVLVPEVAGDDRHGHAHGMRQGVVVEVDRQRRQQPARKQQADRNGLQHGGHVDQDEPACLAVHAAAGFLEHELAVQDEGGDHAQAVRDDDRRDVVQPVAEHDPRAEVDAGGNAAGNQEQQELAADHAEGVPCMATRASVAPTSMLSLIERSSG